MECNCFADLGFDLKDSGACSDTSWKVRYIGRIVVLSFLDDDGVPHMTSLEPSLFEDAVQRTGRKVVARLARNRDAPDFALMLELPMTPTRGDQTPTVALQQAKHFADFHGRRIAGGLLVKPNDVRGGLLRLAAGRPLDGGVGPLPG